MWFEPLQVNIEDEIAALEAEAAIHCKAFDEEVAKRDGFLRQNKAFKVGSETIQDFICGIVES